MSKKVELAGIGEVTLVKRRGAKNLRLSIQPNGAVRVSLPFWTPYSVAIAFTNNKAKWINDHRVLSSPPLKHGQRIGKSYRLSFVENNRAASPQARLGISSITVTSSRLHRPDAIQKTARKAAERALRKEAELLLRDRLEVLSARHSLKYEGLKIKRLTSRWGSCSSHNVITLNYFLIQLPWKLIDYVIIHELAHTKHMNHSRQFWSFVESIVPEARQLRKDIKAYRPILLPTDDVT